MHSNSEQTLLKLPKVVRIVNPVEAFGRTHTSAKSAMSHVRRGHAIVTKDNELFFLTRAEIVRRREQEMLDAAIIRNRKGIIVWAGSANPREYRRPGEVRS